MYNITDYSYNQAKKLNVIIKNSSNPKKKIDVFDKHNNKLASIGAIGYNDYPTYIIKKGKQYANIRKKLYKQRHSKDINNKNGNGFYANKLLW